MKKILVLLGLAALTSSAAVGLSANRPTLENKADPMTTYIEMNKDAFTEPSVAETAGTFAAKDATFWGEGYHFNALDTFFRGESNEGWTGTLTLKSWKQHTQYIYFTWGGASNLENNLVRMKFNYGGIETTVTNDTFVENPMMLRYFKIPNEQFAELDSENGFDMSIDLIDERTSGYGFHNFGYLHVNQTVEQVGDAMRFYLNSLNHDDREWEVNKRKEIYNHYFGNAYLKEVFYHRTTNINEDFEDNDEFLKHWYFDYNYANGANWDLHFDRAIGTDSYRPADTLMPFNKTGNGFFRGWYENDSFGGFVSGDNSIYRFVSRPFTLSGNGIVSIKMAGTASLHVINPLTREDLAWADSQTFSTEGSWDNLAVSNFNTVTMVRHVINLEAYVGNTIQLAIADVGNGGWSAVYFDELIADYDNYPSYQVDHFVHAYGANSFDVYKADKYINATMKSGENSGGIIYTDAALNTNNDNYIKNYVDQSTNKGAYDFLNNSYYPNRGNDEARVGILNAYLALTSYEKAVVNGSSNVLGVSDTPETVGAAIEAWLNEVDQYTIDFDSNGGTGSINDIVMVDGSEYTLPSNSFTAPAGKKFAGWKVNNAGELLQPGDKVDVDADKTIYAIWVDTARTIIESTDSLSALRFHYFEAGLDYTYDDVAIRFGGFIKQSTWSELVEELGAVESYGVIVAETSVLGGQTLKQKYNESNGATVNDKLNALCEIDGVRKASATSTPAEATAQQKNYMGDYSATNYYIWQAKQVIGSGDFTKSYSAVAYIVINGQIVFLQEVSCSAKSIATRVLPSIGGSEDVHAPIQYMANIGD